MQQPCCCNPSTPGLTPGVLWFPISGCRVRTFFCCTLARDVFANQGKRNQALNENKILCHLCSTPSYLFDAKCYKKELSLCKCFEQARYHCTQCQQSIRSDQHVPIVSPINLPFNMIRPTKRTSHFFCVLLKVWILLVVFITAVPLIFLFSRQEGDRDTRKVLHNIREQRPHFVFVLVDNLGWNDVGRC